MILTRVLRDIFQGPKNPAAGSPAAVASRAQSVLNVGGNNKSIPIPNHYQGWNHLLLDIDPSGGPDIVCDARQLETLESQQFDAIYCSHNLEHYYKHDSARVLQGFMHVLKPTGFAEIRVPDLKAVMNRVVANDMDVEDVLYVSPGGPILVRDVIYGWGRKIEQSGEEFFAHKTGFTSKSLRAALELAGFSTIFVAENAPMIEVRAVAFKGQPTQQQRSALGV